MHGSFQAGAAYPWTVQPHSVLGPKDTWTWRAFNAQTNESVEFASHDEAVTHTQAATSRTVESRKGEAAHA